MLVCLEERGYISPSRDGERFHLTLRLFELGQQYPPTKRLITESLPIMQQVTDKLNQSCHLGVLDGDRVVIVAHVDSPLSVGFYVKAGGIGDLMRSTTGHVILANQSPEDVVTKVRSGTPSAGVSSSSRPSGRMRRSPSPRSGR